MLAELKAARQLISEGWCKKNYAVDAEGYAIDPTNPRACKWCVMGAIMRACDKDGPGWMEVVGAFKRVAVIENVTLFNDFGSRETVLRAFDRVIFQLEHRRD